MVLSSKVVFAIYLRPRTFCEHQRAEGTCVSYSSIAFITCVGGVETNNLQFMEHQFVVAAFEQDDGSIMMIRNRLFKDSFTSHEHPFLILLLETTRSS